MKSPSSQIHVVMKQSEIHRHTRKALIMSLLVNGFQALAVIYLLLRLRATGGISW